MIFFNHRTYFTTGIGALPYNNWSEGLEYALHHDLPFYPELLEDSLLGKGLILFNQGPKAIFVKLDRMIELCHDKNIAKIKLQMVHPQTFFHYQKVESKREQARFLLHLKQLLERLEKQTIKIAFFFDAPKIFYDRDELYQFHQKLDFDLEWGIHDCWDKKDQKALGHFFSEQKRVMMLSTPLQDPPNATIKNLAWIVGLNLPLLQCPFLKNEDVNFVALDHPLAVGISPQCGERIKI